MIIVPQTPVVSAVWSPVNFGTTTVTEDATGRLMTPSPLSSSELRLETQPLPTTTGNFTFIGELQVSNVDALWGIFLYDSTTQKTIGFAAYATGIWFGKNNTPSSFNSDYSWNPVGPTEIGLINCFRIVDNGTNITATYSKDKGATWLNTTNNVQPRTNFCTPTHVAWGGRNDGDTRTIKLKSWSLT